MKNPSKSYLIAILVLTPLLFSCEDDEVDLPSIDTPSTYEFSRNGSSSVSFSGQTARIGMAGELGKALTDFEKTEIELLEMFRNETASGGDADPFTDASLNESTKSVKSKVAASKDFFSSNATEANVIKNDFESWIQAQANVVFGSRNSVASAGSPGQIADGDKTRYINEKGLEYNQAIVKGLIGALMLDQALNNYLGTAVLDEADNKENNDNNVVAEDKNYTTMEHKWDEAYGYLYGKSADLTDPNLTIGDDDDFLNKYIGRVESDDDFAGIATDIFNAFKLGRAAIVDRQYDIRDQQGEILRKKLSEVIAIRAVYYMQQGKLAMASNQGGAFHDLSEGYGFIYSLRFTRKANDNAPYFTGAEVETLLDKLMGDGDNGFWDVKASTLDEISSEIAAKFDFTVEQAAD